jgi:hypothetical protein
MFTAGRREEVIVKVAMIVLVALACLAQHSKQFVQAELLKTIKAKSAKVGDPVKARAVSAVLLPGGIAIPEGTILLGEVRAADSNALSISFDQAELNGKKTPLNLSIRAALLAGGPQKNFGGNAGVNAAAPDVHPMKGGPATQVPVTTQSATPSAQADSGGVAQPGRPVAAQAGSVIGMPGVTLMVDDSPQHASKFESSGKELQLKEGLQFMLAVVEAGEGKD